MKNEIKIYVQISLCVCVFVCSLCFSWIYVLPKYMLVCYKIVFISISMKPPLYKLFTSINLQEESSSFPTSLSSLPPSFPKE